MQPSANAPLADCGEWVIPLRSWSLREQVRSLFVAPNKTGRKGPKMKLRNNTESIPNHGAARDAAILQDLDLVNRIARRFQRRVPPCVTLDDLASAGMIGLTLNNLFRAQALAAGTSANPPGWGKVYA